MNILTLIENSQNPYNYINNKGNINIESLIYYLFSKHELELHKNQIQNQKQLKEYIESNKDIILTKLKDNIKKYIDNEIAKIDYDKAVNNYLKNDYLREQLLYFTNDAVNSIIDSIFDDKLSHKKINLLYPEAYKQLYDYFAVYKENITCNRKIIEEQLVKMIPQDLTLLYPETRQIKRHFKIISGPTNSGKTYEAIKELKDAQNGIYLGPLRLLAYEKYKELTDEGIICSLITGEEEIINENSKIQCSTVEMCNLNKSYDCLVLDEAQLCIDEDRGCYWTKVILGSICENIIICCAPEALTLITNLITKCKDTYEIIKKDRLVPLEEAKGNFTKSEKGDAYIVFSRKNVHQLANELRSNTNKKVSILYGNLPYNVRQEEANKFNNGETELLVATDCIGMGLNLPIKRIVMMETSKFDGKEIRNLYKSELKQIIGRAGRFNRYNKGTYTGNNIWKIKSILEKNDIINNIPYIDMPKSLLKINAPIKNIIGVWNLYNIGSEYKKSNNQTTLKLCKYAEKYITNRELLWQVINMKFDYKDDIETNCLIEWRKMIQCLSQNKEYIYKLKHCNSLLEMEEQYKIYDLIYQFYNMIGDEEKRKETIEIRNVLSNQIMKELEEVRNNKKWLK